MVVAVVAVAIIVAVTAWLVQNKKQDTAQTVAQNYTTNAETAATGSQQYKDGSYSASGEYVSPAGKETVNVQLTLKNGVITQVQFDADSQNPASVQLQNQFKSGYSTLVLGKPIDEVSLTVVNGSSLTPKGFMDALDKIKKDAAA